MRFTTLPSPGKGSRRRSGADDLQEGCWGRCDQLTYEPTKYKYELEDNSIKIVENSDNVSHPPHYANGWSNGAEVIDLAEHLSFCAGNVVKYVCRAGRKDPDKHVEDLEKARWYLDREIERVRGH